MASCTAAVPTAPNAQKNHHVAEHFGAKQHVFSRALGARQSAKLGVDPIRVHREDLSDRHPLTFSECTVEVGA